MSLKEHLKQYLASISESQPLYRIGRLDEAGLSRVISHAQKRGFAILTAFRDKYSLKDNRSRNRRLLGQLKSQKMGPIQLNGHWKEAPPGLDYDTAKRKGLLVDVSEESFFVPQASGMKFDQFEKVISSLGLSGFDQDAILIGNPEDGAWLKFKGGGKENLGRLSVGKTADAYSKMRKKNRRIPFIFEGTSRPSNFLSAMAFQKTGLNWLT